MITILFAILLLLLTAPVLFSMILLVLITDGVPLFYRQRRQGRFRQEFKIVKIRTMRYGKVTRIGELLRRLGMDELPQLFNILTGDMTFIGPRPLTSGDITRLGWMEKDHDWRWSVKPGISGLGQLSRVCSKKVSLYRDSVYITRKSLLLNLWIIAQSILLPIRRIRSYYKKRLKK